MDYVHYDPVKHGLVAEVRDWPYSTFHRYAQLGLYPQDWAGAALPRTEGSYGELVLAKGTANADTDAH